jgi:hypothetical protein
MHAILGPSAGRPYAIKTVTVVMRSPFAAGPFVVVVRKEEDP